MRRGGGERHLNKTLDPSHPPALRAAAATHHLPSSSAFAGRFTDDSLLPRIPAAGKVIGETHTRARTQAHTHTQKCTLTRRLGSDGAGGHGCAAQRRAGAGVR